MKDQNYLLTEFYQFSLGVRWVSAELEQLRTELDARTPQSSFSSSIKQCTHPLRIASGLAAFTLATLFLDALPARLILSIIFVLVIYEAVAMANDSRPDGHDSLVGGASISFVTLLAVASIWILSPRDLLIVVLLVASARTFGNAIDRQYPSQPLPRPCPNLYLQKTWFGILGTIVLPVFITTCAIRLQLFDWDYWGLTSVGLATVLADLAATSAKRHYGFHYSNEAAQSSYGPGGRCVQFLSNLFGDERGLLDRFAPLIISSVLLFSLKL